MRLRASILLVAVLVVSAGCTAVDLSGSPADGATTVETTTARTSASGPPTATAEPTTPPPRDYPEPPSNLTNETAKSVALDYHEAWVYNQLRNESGLTGFGLGGIVPDETVVESRTDAGVYVEVKTGYWYGTANSDADASADATIFVNESTISRESGDRIYVS